MLPASRKIYYSRFVLRCRVLFCFLEPNCNHPNNASLVGTCISKEREKHITVPRRQIQGIVWRDLSSARTSLHLNPVMMGYSSFGDFEFGIFRYLRWEQSSEFEIGKNNYSQGRICGWYIGSYPLVQHYSYIVWFIGIPRGYQNDVFPMSEKNYAQHLRRSFTTLASKVESRT